MYRNHILAAVVLYDMIVLNNLYKFIMQMKEYIYLYDLFMIHLYE